MSGQSDIVRGCQYVSHQHSTSLAYYRQLPRAPLWQSLRFYPRMAPWRPIRDILFWPNRSLCEVPEKVSSAVAAHATREVSWCTRKSARICAPQTPWATATYTVACGNWVRFQTSCMASLNAARSASDFLHYRRRVRARRIKAPNHSRSPSSGIPNSPKVGPAKSRPTHWTR